MNFEDIKITELDDKRSYNPDRSYALYNMYLRLSSSPPSEWVELFNNQRRFPRHSMWREAWIEGSYIVVYCVPDEVEKYHLRDLKEDVTRTNSLYKQYLEELARQESIERQRQNEEQQRLKDIKDRLKFD